MDFFKIFTVFARAVFHVYIFSRREHLSHPACQHSVFRAETLKSEADVSEYCVTVSGGDAEFIRSHGSRKTVEFRTRPGKGFM